MQFLRQHLSWTLCVWLACQISALAAPVVLAVAGSHPADEICTCPGGDHETCPMHHGKQADGQGTAVCGVSACCAPVDVALLSMAGGAGVMPEAIQLPLRLVSSGVAIVSSRVFDLVGSHDTPPPRL